MSQSIAVVVGNTEYQSLASLTCCADDVRHIKKLLTATQKFSQIVEIIDKPVDEVKEQLRQLANIDNEFNEVFFYFSGHGLSNANDFYMCFEGFDEGSPNTTGLSRTEALKLLREFGADLSVVVVDACESGRNLIKSEISPLTKDVGSGFSNFVQFSSCTETQFSMAGDDLSVFTKQFVKACVKKTSGIVYYSDVENALRDAFLDDPSQTPHFIRQGTSQEKFCEKAEWLGALRGQLESLTVLVDSPTTETSHAPAISLAKAEIEKIEQQVPSKEIAQSFVNEIFSSVLRDASEVPEVDEFFDVRSVSHDDFEYVQNKKAVISLLDRRGGSDSFVESDVEKKKRRQPFGGLGNAALLAAFGSTEEYDTTYNIWNRCELKSVHVGMYFEPKSMALNRVFSEIVFLPRLTECLVLTCNSFERRSGWGTFNEYEGTKKWKWSSHSWYENPDDVAAKSVSDPYEFVRDYILSFADSE